MENETETNDQSGKIPYGEPVFISHGANIITPIIEDWDTEKYKKLEGARQRLLKSAEDLGKAWLKLNAATKYFHQILLEIKEHPEKTAELWDAFTQSIKEEAEEWPSEAEMYGEGEAPAHQKCGSKWVLSDEERRKLDEYYKTMNNPNSSKGIKRRL